MSLTVLEAARASKLPVGDRVDGPGKVTGAAKYAGDISRPGMLCGKVLRGTLPHARLLQVATAAARTLPGVHAILTGADLPADLRVGRGMRDMPVLAREKVRFVGERIAAVAADSSEIADEALRLIQVEYDELPAVFHPLDAMHYGSPLVHDPDQVRAWAPPGQTVPAYPNGVAAPVWGASVDDVLHALAAADHVFEHTFRTPAQHQAYLEPHACVVEVDQLGVTHIWGTIKAPLVLAQYLEDALGLHREQLAIHLLPLGGDFGGKGSLMDIPLAYFLAQATGRPIRMAMSYGEELAAGNPRHASAIVVRSGVKHDGRLVARWVQGYFNSGAYAAFKPAADGTLPGFRRGSFGSYAIPVQRAECHMIYTNTVPCGHMRSPGEAQSAYALECHTDIIARELGMDPVEFRVLNSSSAPRAGLEGAGPGPLPRIREVLEAAATAIDLRGPKPDSVGRGVALIEFGTSPERFSAALVLGSHGHLTLQTPIVDNGGGQLTTLRQLVAEEFGVHPELVAVQQTIDGMEVDRGPTGARTTRLVGKLVIDLSHRVQARLAAAIAEEFGLVLEQVAAGNGGFRLPDGRFLTLVQAAALVGEDVREMLLLDPAADSCSIHLATAAEVRVDRETGRVEVLRVVSVHEVGRVVEPLLFQAQIQGGLVQGLGYALMEDLCMEDGRVVTSNLHEYKIPTAADIPPLEIVVVPPDPGLGLTPIGEGPNAGLPAAIANAVVDAIGPYPFDLPLLPEAVRTIGRLG